jgi:hypothetical protein
VRALDDAGKRYDLAETDVEPVNAGRPRAVAVIGWIVLVLALLRVLNDAAFYVYWKIGGLQEGLPIPGIGDPRSPLYFLKHLFRYLGPIALVQGAVAAAVAIVAWNFLQLRSWARTALEVFFWIGLLFLAAFTVFFIAVWTHALEGQTGVRAAQMRLWGPVAAGCVAIVAGGLLGTLIWFLRRPNVRRAFEGPAS